MFRLSGSRVVVTLCVCLPKLKHLSFILSHLLGMLDFFSPMLRTAQFKQTFEEVEYFGSLGGFPEVLAGRGNDV